MIKILISGKRKFAAVPDSDLPEITLFIAAYNEKDCAIDKIQNSLQLDYPPEKLKMVWVTDGSDDGTPEIVSGFPRVTVYHEQKRSGKIGAMNRGMAFVSSPLTVFSDCNTILAPQALKRIAEIFTNPEVGCVSGEKRIISSKKESAAGSGEGIYWKYESFLKRMDSEFYNTVGAAGELFAIRTSLYTTIEHDTLLDDFIISLRIAAQGKKIIYCPEAYAIEKPSENVKEELKRKIRIAAGGFQSLGRISEIMNPFRFPIFSFQFISHKVLRWTAVPVALLLLLPVNFFLAIDHGFFSIAFYPLVFWGQILFYLLALTGALFQNRHFALKIIFIPYYILIMNYCQYAGFFRFLKKQQSVSWEKARRKS